eukprot:SAG31_NODE_629_length_13436_cov_116.287825_3_plen_67_part_00
MNGNLALISLSNIHLCVSKRFAPLRLMFSAYVQLPAPQAIAHSRIRVCRMTVVVKLLATKQSGNSL